MNIKSFSQNCQSCDMPMKNDTAGGGTNLDGSRSVDYCSYCFGGGDFYYKGDDVAAYQRFVIAGMVERGWWRPLAWLMTRRIPRLARWRLARWR